MKITGLFILLCLLLNFPAAGQGDVPIGGWKSYLPYTTGKHVTQNESTIFYAADFSLLAIDKEENSVQRLTKVNGLSDVEIDILKHSPFDDKMILVYKNGNIDIVSDNGIINFPFVKQKDIQGDKRIYDINFITPDRVFLATGFGILDFNPQSVTVTNDIRTGIAVQSTAIFDGFFYAATEEGIYRAEDSPFVNLLDFGSNWNLLEADLGFPQDYSSRQVLSLDDRMVLDINDSLFFFQSNKLENFYHKPGFGFQFLTAEGSHIVTGIDCQGGCKDKIVIFEKTGQVLQEIGISCISEDIRYAIEDENGRFWIADNSRSFRMLPAVGARCDSTIYEGPQSENIWDLEVSGDELWVATGGFNQTRSYLFRQDGVLRQKSNGSWVQYNRNTRPEMLGEDGMKGEDDLSDFVKVAAAPSGDKVWLASYFEGLLEFDLNADQMTLFNDTNSGIKKVEGDPKRNRVAGLAFDSQENLWVTSYLGADPFAVFIKEDRNWKSFSPARCGGFTELLDVAVDGSNNKWFRVGSSSAGLVVFNEGDLNDPNDDVCRVITENNSNLPSNEVLSLTVDLDGDIWVGTANGVVIFQCGSQVFDPDICPGFLQIVNVGGDNEFLLKGESVQAIAVDGANRKWFGTQNGVFLQSPSGDELLGTYTETNSPLFDNNIIDIDIRQTTGEVFIGSNRGLQSIRTDATEGFLVNTANVTIFPNPVHPDYFGPIAIKGLARDANVKITDINGTLVYETTALGGQAVWDGNDYNGRRADTGVYLVFSTNTKTFGSPDADMVGKILLIK